MTDTTVSQIPLKRCTKCGEEKPATAEWFYLRNAKLKASCRACGNADSKRYRVDNAEKIREWTRQYAVDNAEKIREYKQQHYVDNVEKERARRRRYYLENTEKVLERKQRYRAANAEKIREYKQQWRADNPEKERVSCSRRRAHIRAADGTHNAADIRLLLKTQKHNCWWCGKPLDISNYHVDHRVPLARGGSNAPENLCITCPTCNMRKHDKLPQEWNGRLL